MSIQTLARLSLAVGLVAAVAGCKAMPTAPPPPPPAAESTAVASVQLLVSSRTGGDQRLDVAAVVLTASRKPAPGVAVTFTVTNGTLTAATAVTDESGYARSIASANWQNTITASAAGLTDSYKVTGVAPVVTPLTVSISAPNTIYEDDTFSFGVNVSGGSGLRVIRWNFGDGDVSTANDFSPSHRYGSDGNYTVSLEIADDQGRTANTSKRITVLPAPVSTPATPVTPAVTASIVCTIVTPIRRTCTATAMYNGVAIASALVNPIRIQWGDGSDDTATNGVAISHNYALGTTGNKVIRVTGSLTTGETFDSQITISVG